jgi:hypothetical protein
MSIDAPEKPKNPHSPQKIQAELLPIVYVERRKITSEEGM